MQGDSGICRELSARSLKTLNKRNAQDRSTPEFELDMVVVSIIGGKRRCINVEADQSMWHEYPTRIVTRESSINGSFGGTKCYYMEWDAFLEEGVC